MGAVRRARHSRSISGINTRNQRQSSSAAAACNEDWAHMSASLLLLEHSPPGLDGHNTKHQKRRIVTPRNLLDYSGTLCPQKARLSLRLPPRSQSPCCPERVPAWREALQVVHATSLFACYYPLSSAAKRPVWSGLFLVLFALSFRLVRSAQ